MGVLNRAAIAEWARPYTEAMDLPYLSIHLVSILRAMLLWWSVQLLSHGVSPKLFPRSFANMPARTRTQWDIHVVSFTHSMVVAPLALYFWLGIDESTDRLWGYDYTLGQMYALSLGYFVWDVIVSLRYEGFAFVLHGVLGLVACILVYKPLFMFDGLGILIWELSTPFLNIHWFLDKLHLTGSRIQFVNALLLLLTYVGVRLLLGVYMSYSLITLIWTPTHRTLPLGYKLLYTIGLPSLNVLNYMWFFKMVRAIRKRFPAEVKEKPQ
ncbi:lipid homeostasis protein [Malassezia pachydermatis]|uniref:TLC domain-containing protein n=1 Tax=Malassezia pachydermatis TaxID=77020 RepID=A0A0M8MRX6_9BASI|nr:hypothetical protein Malapachy_1682 [Malassezia pachydermatis]KOS13114.1 hypothetical protein Malapachy_1682 [Malassezia pachydermatis]